MAISTSCWSPTARTGRPRGITSDFRLEKEFRFGFGTVSVFVDVSNLLGNKYVYSGLNPGGVWAPTDENTSSGTRTLGYNYRRITSVSGLRTFRVSARVSF